MSDELKVEDHRSTGTDPAQGDGSAPPSPIADDLLKQAKSKGYSHGYNERTSSICSEFGVANLDELKQMVGEHRADLEKKETTALVEKEERESLAKELQETRKRAKAFETEAEKLSILRSEIKKERLKNEGLARGIRPTAIELVTKELDAKVSWNDDFTKLRNDDGDIEDFDGVFSKIKEAHPYLFEEKQRQGVNMSNDSQNRKPEWKPSYSSLEERIKGL